MIWSLSTEIAIGLSGSILNQNAAPKWGVGTQLTLTLTVRLPAENPESLQKAWRARLSSIEKTLDHVHLAKDHASFHGRNLDEKTLLDWVYGVLRNESAIFSTLQSVELRSPQKFSICKWNQTV